ncbi:apolipoprotein N-acyltransferase [Sphingomonas parva]|uniref:Apolipoprotein N-acyltransferase n=1 Tax=Sphingomonas parva TaxID=2555898 RepID=A0A4Y8ZQM3_9SPHN|nr:apolipoprotein N-acyltransferase [Sphingomonas parva]TFI58264.1 apolipoprotein N-acyltransferase [Sphingomonas parva]
MKHNLLALLIGALAACGFAPLGMWPVTLAGFAMLLGLIAEAPRLRSALARGWFFGVGHFTVGLNWIATAFTFQAAMPPWLGWIAVFLLSLYLAVYPAAAAGLAWRYGRGDPLRRVLVFAAAWIVTEWLRATMFTGFAWNPLGVSLLPTSVSWLAPWLGTYGLSGVAALIAGLPLLLVRKAWRPAAALAGTIALATLGATLLRPPPAGHGRIALRIVQPNIGQQDKWREGFEAENLARLERLSAGRGGAPRLLLWPEAAVTRPLQNELRYPELQAEAERLRRRVGAMLGSQDLLLTGGVTWRSRDGQEISSATNSVFAIDPSGRILARYDKAHLVPYGEYLPMRPLLSSIGLSRLAPGDVDFDFGPGAQTLTLPGIGEVGFQLCYEIIFSGEVVDPENRPAFLFNPSNDAWFGAWGPPQHLAQARLRALEEGLPILRSTPTGISAVIDAEGRLLASLPWRTEGVIDARLPQPKPPTLFARAGNLLPLGFALLLATLAFALFRRARAIAEPANPR